MNRPDPPDRSDRARAEPVRLPLVLPPPVPEATRAGFPVLATVAPVAGALVLWVVTGSAMSLAFAALGPLVAVASVFDARRQSRRAGRRGRAERAGLLADLRAAISERHEMELRAAWSRAPQARRILEADGVDWRQAVPGEVVLGRGVTGSSLRIDGSAADEDDRSILEQASRLEDAPVIAALEAGVGIVGPTVLARAAARALLVQAAQRCRPGVVQITAPDGPAWAWTEALPHRGGGGERAIRVIEAVEAGAATGLRREAGASAGRWGGATIALGSDRAALPAGLAVIVTVEGHRRALVEAPGTGAPPHMVVPELIGASEAGEWALRMRLAAAREGIGAAALAPPDRVVLDELSQPAIEPGSRTGLRVAIGALAAGALEIDLVRDGPHAIVAGTTGSGKSEFLLAWIVALARAHPPDRVAFLLVDFKGGASFEPVADLPHLTGIVTDLDEAQAERAVLSLRAELRHREAVLLAEHARDIADLHPGVDLARLVIVVDEFQAMIERFPDLGGVIADIAARGRSLGVHLVLASQRPNGVLREQVTANCAIRVSLRVMQRADSIAVVGTDAAATIGSDRPGRGIADRGDGCPVLFQSAQADPRSILAARSHAGARPARRPWVDPLPRRLEMHELDAAAASGPPMQKHGSLAMAFGLVDEPEHQRHGVAEWTPELDGHLLVAGAPGSGRSGALAAIDRAASRGLDPGAIARLAGPASAQWDLLRLTLERLRRGDAPRLLLVDDLDIRFREWPEEYRFAAASMLEAILREGRAHALAVAAAVSQAHRLPPGARESFGQTLLLRHPSRSDLVQAGGSGESWRRDDPPGAGEWRAHRVQVVAAPAQPGSAAVPVARLRLGRESLYAVVSASPRADADAFRAAGVTPMLLGPTIDGAVRASLDDIGAAGAAPIAVVGDVEAWSGNWSTAAMMRERAVVVVHGGQREHRVFGSGPALPPLLDDPVEQCWVTRGSEAPVRAAWPPLATADLDGRSANPEPHRRRTFPEASDSPPRRT